LQSLNLSVVSILTSSDGSSINHPPDHYQETS